MKIYENLLLILNQCLVSKVFILTGKELDVDFYFMNNVKRTSISHLLTESVAPFILSIERHFL